MTKRERRFKIEIPCSEKQVGNYYKILQERFGKDLIPPHSFLRAVPKKNPYGIIIITDNNREVQGGIELYGLRGDFFDEYIAGDKADPDFREEHCLDVQETIADGRLYCAITILEFKTPSGHADNERIREIKQHLLIAAASVIKKAYFKNPDARVSLSIYAIGASHLGKILLKAAGFILEDDGKIRKDGTQRKDGMPLYCLYLRGNLLDSLPEELINRRAKGSTANHGDLEVIDRTMIGSSAKKS